MLSCSDSRAYLGPRQIPTGWEITLDLIRKLAATSNESAEPDPENWFEKKYGEAPSLFKASR